MIDEAIQATFRDFEQVDVLFKTYLEGALQWAKQRLGVGYCFQLEIVDGQFQCSFASSNWPRYYDGPPMATAPEAIVMAVCAYLNGV